MITWINPDLLIDYFTDQEAWEQYAQQYRNWRESSEYTGREKFTFVKHKKPRLKCRGCGKFMKDAYIEGDSYTWHMKEKCLTKLVLSRMAKEKQENK